MVSVRDMLNLRCLLPIQVNNLVFPDGLICDHGIQRK